MWTSPWLPKIYLFTLLMLLSFIEWKNFSPTPDIYSHNLWKLRLLVYFLWLTLFLNDFFNLTSLEFWLSLFPFEELSTTLNLSFQLVLPHYICRAVILIYNFLVLLKNYICLINLLACQATYFFNYSQTQPCNLTSPLAWHQKLRFI